MPPAMVAEIRRNKKWHGWWYGSPRIYQEFANIDIKGDCKSVAILVRHTGVMLSTEKMVLANYRLP